MTLGRFVVSCGIFRGVVWTPECVGSGVVHRLSCPHGTWDLKFPNQGSRLHPVH